MKKGSKVRVPKGRSQLDEYAITDSDIEIDGFAAGDDRIALAKGAGGDSEDEIDEEAVYDLDEVSCECSTMGSISSSATPRARRSGLPSSPQAWQQPCAAAASRATPASGAWHLSGSNAQTWMNHNSPPRTGLVLTQPACMAAITSKSPRLAVQLLCSKTSS